MEDKIKLKKVKTDKSLFACKICVARYGLTLQEKDRIFETEEELFEHMENVHGIPVIREGETEADAKKRCAEKGIGEDVTKCQCEDCKSMRSEILR